MWLQSSSQFLITIFRQAPPLPPVHVAKYDFKGCPCRGFIRTKPNVFLQVPLLLFLDSRTFLTQLPFFTLQVTGARVKETAASSYSSNLLYSQVKPQQGWIEYALKAAVVDFIYESMPCQVRPISLISSG